MPIVSATRSRTRPGRLSNSAAASIRMQPPGNVSLAM